MCHDVAAVCGLCAAGLTIAAPFVVKAMMMAPNSKSVVDGSLVVICGLVVAANVGLQLGNTLRPSFSRGKKFLIANRTIEGNSP